MSEKIALKRKGSLAKIATKVIAKDIAKNSYAEKRDLFPNVDTMHKAYKKYTITKKNHSTPGKYKGELPKEVTKAIVKKTGKTILKKNNKKMEKYISKHGDPYSYQQWDD